MPLSFGQAESAGGSPVELYTVRRGGLSWFYTSASTAQTVSGITYAPAVVRREAVAQQSDEPGVRVKVFVALDSDLATTLQAASQDTTTVSIERYHASALAGARLVFLGEVTGMTFRGAEIELQVATVERRFKQLIPRVLVRRTCPWAVYSPSCGVDKTLFAQATTVASISGQIVTVADAGGFADGWFLNGIIEVTSGTATNALLFVSLHAGNALTVWTPVPAGLAAGDSVTLYPGCDKTSATCTSKFNNFENFGGFPDLPVIDPRRAGMI